MRTRCPKGDIHLPSEGAGGRWLDRMVQLLSWLGALVLLFIALSVSVATLSRYFLNEPLAWTIELNSQMLLFMTFLGLALVTRENGHVRLEIISADRFPRVARVLDGMADITGLAISAVLFGASLWITVDSYVKGTIAVSILPVPRWIYLSVIPVGSLLTVLQYLRQFMTGTRVFDKDGGI